jgi:hypothetical protein
LNTNYCLHAAVLPVARKKPGLLTTLKAVKPPRFITKFLTPGLWLIGISCTSPDVVILRPLNAPNGCPGFAHVPVLTPVSASILFHIIVKVLALSPCL